MDFLDNQLTPSTGTIRMRALLDNAQRQFTPGLFARVRLPGSAEFNATLIDDKAVLTDQIANMFMSLIKRVKRSAVILRRAVWPTVCASCSRG